MKKVSIICSDEEALQLITLWIPKMKGWGFTVEDIAEPDSKLPKLEAPPNGSLKEFRDKERKRDYKVEYAKRTGKIDGRKNPVFHGRTATPPGLQDAIVRAGRTYGDFPTKGFKLNDMANVLAQSDFEVNRKVLNNNITGLRKKGLIEVIGGDKTFGFVYRMTQQGTVPYEPASH